MDHSNHYCDLRMLVYDWYDGPVGGVVYIPERAASFCFYLLDWDSEHRIRVFALQSISGNFEEIVRSLTESRPKWPVWLPADLVHPNERTLDWISAVKALRFRSDDIDSLLVWDTKVERMINLQDFQSQDEYTAVSWFDAVETAGGPTDWFGLLSIPRI